MAEAGPPAVSVLIVSHNKAPSLRRCLESVERSTNRENIEIVVVDNGSGDGTSQIGSEFPNLRLLRLPRNFGLTKALNIGIRASSGEFVLFLKPEAEVFPDTVSALAGRLEAEPEAVAVCPLLIDAGGEPATRVYRLPTPNSIYLAWRLDGFRETVPVDPAAESLAVEYPILDAFMIRGYFLKGMRYLDERYGQFWADAELCFQIRRASKKILLLPGIRAVDHSDKSRPAPLEPAARALLSADCALGAVAYVGKHYGFAAGLKLRLAACLRCLASAVLALVSLRDPGYHFARLNFLLNGQKIDGSQRQL